MCPVVVLRSRALSRILFFLSVQVSIIKVLVALSSLFLFGHSVLGANGQ